MKTTTARQVTVWLLSLTSLVGAGGYALLAAQSGGAGGTAEAQDIRLSAAAPLVSLKFTPCAENPTLDCGTVKVPVDYARPFGESVGIAVIRARATKPSARIGVLVGNPGGPGISGVDFVLSVAGAPGISRLRESFDIVSFDPRGVKRSRAVQCRFDLPAQPSESNDAELEAFFDELGRRHAEACLEQNGSFVAHLGTANVARDIDMIRRALGEAQITYAAGSYGSELGATYVSMFPWRVRAMMLDGGISPEFHDFSIEAWTQYASGFEKAFQRLDQLCRRDAGCRLQSSGAVVVMDEVLARLRSAPVTGPTGVRLTAGWLQNIMADLLGSQRNWPLMVDALADAQAGDYRILFALIPSIGGGGGNTALYPIWCNDYGTRRPAADYLRIDEAVGALNPRFFGRFFVAESVALCASWPAAESPEIVNVARRVSTPILIVANDFDPNTPIVAAHGMARALGMEDSLLRYEGGGHTAFFQGITCIDQAIETYLLELRLPPAGTTCPAQPVSFGASVRARAANGTSVPAVATGLWSGPSVHRHRLLSR